MLYREPRAQTLLNIYWVPISLQATALGAIAVPAALGDMSGSDAAQAFARLASLVALVSILVPPLAGAYSDRLRAAHGRRRGMIVVGAVVDTLGLLVMMRADTPLELGLGYLLATAGLAMSSAAYQALIPELVVKEAWGTAAGYRGMAMLIGALLGLMIASIFGPWQTFLASLLLMILGLFSLVSLREPDNSIETRREEPAHIVNWRDFGFTFASRFCVMFGMALLTVFILFFFKDVLKVANASVGTGLVAMLAIAGAILSSLWVGMYSDRVSRKLTVIAATALMAFAALGFGFFPIQHAILGFGLLFGVGLGAFRSTDWALALDTLPQMRDVARDLGLMGVAAGTPGFLAPLVGGVILASFTEPLMGYRVLFWTAAASFVSGGVFAAFVGTRSSLSLLWAVPVRGLIVLFLAPYMNIAYRVRGYGRLPRRRGATLLISNHQHDLDTMALLMRVYLQSPLRHPIFSVASRRLFEPGFLSTRTPWIAALASRYNLGGFLRVVLGAFPLESQLLTRPVASYAHAWQRPGRRAGELFEPWVLGRIGLAPDAPLELIWRWRYLRRAQFLASFRVLQPPFRQREMDRLRREVRDDLVRQQALLRRGATVYLAPEGRYTQDGRLGRFRAAYSSLAPLAEVWLAPISYDPFVGRRLSMLFRVLPRGDRDARLLLLAARPVTASQVAAQAVLRAEGGPRSLRELEREALNLLFALPADIFPDPQLDKNPVGMLRAAFRGLVRQGWLVRNGDGWARARHGKNPYFPQVDDLLAYQAGMLEQTLENLHLLQQAEDQSGAWLGSSRMRAPYSK